MDYSVGGGGVRIQQASTSAALATSLLAGSPPSLGSPNAPVAIVEFGDYQCPSCGGWYQNQETAIIQNLVNTGKAKLIWRDFDYYGPDSVSASEAAYAAGDQGKFWQFHDLLFQNQHTPNSGWASRENMDKFAQQLGLNIAQFDQDFNGGKYDSTINSNHALGVQAGVTGTPTFFLVGPNSNIVTISGGQPEPVFEQAVTQLTSSPSPEYSNLVVVPAVSLLVTLALVAARSKRRR
jgi:protein-disulfide isomerase